MPLDTLWWQCNSCKLWLFTCKCKDKNLKKNVYWNLHRKVPSYTYIWDVRNSFKQTVQIDRDILNDRFFWFLRRGFEQQMSWFLNALMPLSPYFITTDTTFYNRDELNGFRIECFHSSYSYPLFPLSYQNYFQISYHQYEMWNALSALRCIDKQFCLSLQYCQYYHIAC